MNQMQFIRALSICPARPRSNAKSTRDEEESEKCQNNSSSLIHGRFSTGSQLPNADLRVHATSGAAESDMGIK